MILVPKFITIDLRGLVSHAIDLGESVNWLRNSPVVVLLALLTACGGNKVVLTTDDSADYRSAKQLPPLKKVISPPAPAAPAIQSTASAPAPAPAASTPQPSNRPATVAATSSPPVNVITTSIIDVSNDRKRMKIDAGLDVAWRYLLDDLRSSTVTVHTRNKTAARIEIGCGEFDDTVTATESGGWKIFSRDEYEFEYCVMELSEDRGATLVTMLDRRGDEVKSAQSMAIFNKILNN